MSADSSVQHVAKYCAQGCGPGVVVDACVPEQSDVVGRQIEWQLEQSDRRMAGVILRQSTRCDADAVAVLDDGKQ